MTAKYRFERCGKSIFRIKYHMFDDGMTGLCIRYTIQEPMDIPKNLWERIKQTFTCSTYHFGYWTPALADDTLEERVNAAMLDIISATDKRSAVENTWDNL